MGDGGFEERFELTEAEDEGSSSGVCGTRLEPWRSGVGCVGVGEAGSADGFSGVVGAVPAAAPFTEAGVGVEAPLVAPPLISFSSSAFSSSVIIVVQREGVRWGDKSHES